MESVASVKGHPIHPMLIPYPFALLTSAAAFDVGARLSTRDTWSQTARQLTNVGLGAAVLAAIPGIVDYFGTVPPRTSASRTATRHALSNVSALACFAVAHANRGRDGRLPGAGMALALLGTGLLSLGGWLGGQLVYHEHVAVAGAGTRAELEEAGRDAEWRAPAPTASQPASAEASAVSRSPGHPAP